MHRIIDAIKSIVGHLRMIDLKNMNIAEISSIWRSHAQCDMSFVFIVAFIALSLLLCLSNVEQKCNDIRGQQNNFVY